jgi:uncharacterized protein YbjT (DUF2867 family)
MILVTGAGGNVGSPLVETLAADGAPLRAAYHHSEKVDAARARGLDAVQLDFADPDSLDRALDGADRLFLLTPNGPDQMDWEARAAARAARAGVRHIVKLSGWDCDRLDYTLARIHRAGERAVEVTGCGWTHLRANGFMQNAVTYLAPSIRAEGRFYATAADAPVAMVDARDIAAVAARALTEPGHAGRAYRLSGPEPVTAHDLARMLGEETGQRVDCVDLTAQAYRQGLVDIGLPAWLADQLIDLHAMYARGEAGAPSGDVEAVTGRPPTALRSFLHEHRTAFVPPSGRG